MSAKSLQKKELLINQLQHHTYVTLRPSPLQGIGVFALRDITKGQKGIFSNDKSEWIPLSKAEVNDLPQHSKALIENFCLFDDNFYYVPEYGFKMMDLVVYLNHSDHPNVRSINDGEDFEALRDIASGEELLVDYGEIVESEQ